MTNFIQVEDYELWMRFTDGPLIPTIKDNKGKDIPKLKSQHGFVDFKMLQKMSRLNVFL